MHRTLIAVSIVAVAAWGLQGAPACAADPWELTRLPVVEVASSGVLPLPDGNLLEMGWSSAKSYEIPGTDTFLPRATCQATHAEGELILGIEVRGDTEGLRSQARQRDDEAVWEDDAVEILLDPGLGLREGFRILITPANVIYDEALSEGGAAATPSRNLPIRSGVRVDRTRWTVEVAIPWAALRMRGTKGDLFGLNIAVRRAGSFVASLTQLAPEKSLVGLAVAAVETEELDDNSLRVTFIGATAIEDQLSIELTARNRLHQTNQFGLRTRTISAGGATDELAVMLIANRETARLIRGPYNVAGGDYCLVLIEASDRNALRAPRPLGITAAIGRPAAE